MNTHVSEHLYVSKVNLLSHSHAMLSSPAPVFLSSSAVSPPYPAEIRLYWQSFAAPYTCRLNLSFNSCDITEHPPSRLICFFPVRVRSPGPLLPALAAAAALLPSPGGVDALNELIKLALSPTVLHFTCACVCVLQTHCGKTTLLAFSTLELSH